MTGHLRLTLTPVCWTLSSELLANHRLTDEGRDGGREGGREGEVKEGANLYKAESEGVRV